MTIFIPYNTAGSGGPPVFVAALSKHLKSRGHKVIHRFSLSFDILLVIAECPLSLALYAKLAGKRIVQRLDGVYHPAANHHFYFLKNLRMQIIHNCLADHVIYQSQFAQKSCQTLLGQREKNTSIIYNGVAAASSTPLRLSGFVGQAPVIPGDSIPGLPSEALAEEGVFPAAATGSPAAVPLNGTKAESAGSAKSIELTTFASFRRVDQIKPILESVKHLTIPYHLHIYGPYTAQLSSLFQSLKNSPQITYHGPRKHSQLLVDIKHHDIFLFSDQSACPNAVLEALAAGLPVVAFNRGSLPELIQPGRSGEVVSLTPHDPWRDSYPFNQKSYYQFARSIAIVANHLSRYRDHAIRRCQDTFDITATCKQYEEVLRPPG